jgi:hypothetical protein
MRQLTFATGGGRGREFVGFRERKQRHKSRYPAQGDEDAANYVTAGAATARKGIDEKTKRGDDVVSEAIKFPNLSKLMCI